MKAVIGVFVGICVAWCVCASEVSAAKGPYGVKSGIITYRMTGATSGEEIVQFINNGATEARKTTTVVKVLGFTSEDKSLTIRNNEWVSTIDLKEKTGTRMNIKDVQAAYQGGEAGAARYTDDMLKEMGAEKVGTEVVAGEKCTVYEIVSLGSRVSLWKGIALKTEVNVMGIQSIVEATDVQVNVPVDKSVFEIPAGIELEDVAIDPEQMRANMAQAEEAMAGMNTAEMPETATSEQMGSMFGAMFKQHADENMTEDEQETASSFVSGFMKSLSQE